ncbi:MAG: transcription elongation factor GreA [Chloroflexi bacterium]|nr:transcription elongation factor GreA [Chloroflexota bacterium]
MAKGEPAEPATLSREGLAELEAELASLKSRRSSAIEEVRKAAADKDFRENAPLEAARQQHGQLVGRIKELEQILKTAVIVNGSKGTNLKVNVGDTVVLQDTASGEESRYMIVSPREVDPAKSRISNVSPIGKAVIGRGIGEVVEVAVPSRKLRYHIKSIER